jgi:hypothetical protein
MKVHQCHCYQALEPFSDNESSRIVEFLYQDEVPLSAMARQNRAGAGFGPRLSVF